MKPYIRWTKPRQSNELMCIWCGATRPTLHLPKLEIDAVTRTLGPLLLMAFALHEIQRRERGAA